MPTIHNRSKQVQVFNLPCPKDCAGDTPHGCKIIETQQMAETPDGTRGIRIAQKHITGSVTFLAGEKKEVPDTVAESPHVKRALDRGTLRLLK